VRQRSETDLPLSHPAAKSKTKWINLIANYWASLDSCTHFESYPIGHRWLPSPIHSKGAVSHYFKGKTLG